MLDFTYLIADGYFLKFVGIDNQWKIKACNISVSVAFVKANTMNFVTIFIFLLAVAVTAFQLHTDTDTDTDTEFYYTLAAISRIAE